MTGLQRATTYEARVQASCAEDDQSAWSNPISFTTECGIWPVDAQNAFIEDFEDVEASDFPPTCWEKFSHEMSGYTYWYLNSNNGLGSSAAYSYWNEGYAFLVMPYMHIEGDATLTFDYLISSGDYDESCSVVASTGAMTFTDFNQTIWEADGNNLPTGRASATVSLANYNGQDIYIAFRFKGSGTSGCTWYVDNVAISVEAVTQTIELAEGVNWISVDVDITLEDLEDALVEALPGSSGMKIISQGDGYTQYNGSTWRGGLRTLDLAQMYRIEVPSACEITLTGNLVNMAENTVTINPGNNWIAFPLNTSMSVDEAFAGFPAPGDKISSQGDGYTQYNGRVWRGGLQNLDPGKGYIYNSTATGTKTLVFPSSSK